MPSPGEAVVPELDINAFLFLAPGPVPVLHCVGECLRAIRRGPGSEITHVTVKMEVPPELFNEPGAQRLTASLPSGMAVPSVSAPDSWPAVLRLVAVGSAKTDPYR